MTHKENITAILECYFAGFKKEIIDSACNRILEQESNIGRCKDCKNFRELPYHTETLGRCIYHSGLCPKGDWYCADFEPQESEDKK